MAGGQHLGMILDKSLHHRMMHFSDLFTFFLDPKAVRQRTMRRWAAPHRLMNDRLAISKLIIRETLQIYLSVNTYQIHPFENETGMLLGLFHDCSRNPVIQGNTSSAQRGSVNHRGRQFSLFANSTCWVHINTQRAGGLAVLRGGLWIPGQDLRVGLLGTCHTLLLQPLPPLPRFLFPTRLHLLLINTIIMSLCTWGKKHYSLHPQPQS